MNKEGDTDGLFIRLLLLVEAVRAEQVAVLRGEDEDRILRDARLGERHPQIRDAVIECRCVCIIASQILTSLLEIRGLYVRSDLDFRRLVQGPVQAGAVS